MISGCFITKNEAGNIANFIKNVQPFLDEIIIVDGLSNDNTADIATGLNCLVFKREFDNYANMRNFSLEKARYPWRFTLDLDERISEGFINGAKGLIKDTKYDCFLIRNIHYRSDDNKIIAVGWKRVLFRNYGIYWGDIHERVIGVKNEYKIEDKNIFSEEHKSAKHQFEILQKYKKTLIDLYHKYRQNKENLLMNRITDLLIPEHNENVVKWLEDNQEKTLSLINRNTDL